jgi:hypothetical protein
MPEPQRQSHEDDENGVNKEGETSQTKSAPPYCIPIQAVNPQTGVKDWTLYIRQRTLEIVGKRRQRGFALELGNTVQQAVLAPTGIFRGVTDYDREDGEEDWLVYASRPPHAYEYKSGNQVAPWKGEEVFLVFFDGDRILQMPWKWVSPDPKNSGLSIDFDRRFKERLL